MAQVRTETIRLDKVERGDVIVLGSLSAMRVKKLKDKAGRTSVRGVSTSSGFVIEHTANGANRVMRLTTA